MGKYAGNPLIYPLEYETTSGSSSSPRSGYALMSPWPRNSGALVRKDY
jgi:hypothetical protein